jgi:hypothetical protein
MKLTLIHLFIFLWASLINADSLNLAACKINFAGSISFPIKITRHDEFYFGVKISPSFGIFIKDSLEQRVQFSLNANYIFSKQERVIKTPVFWDISWATLYYFQTHSRFRPYIGGGVGVGFMDMNLHSINILFDMPVGVLIELNQSLALDIGIPLRIRASPRAFFDSVELPLGVIGLRYFF